VTPGTIIRRSFLIANLKRDSTALLGMAGDTLASKKRGRVGTRGLKVRIMTGDAAEPTCTVAITLAERHREIVLEQITPQRILAGWWDHQNGQRSIQRRSGKEVAVVFARLQDACIAGLMARHADVIGGPK
jgi:hypothetical protein